MAVVFRHRQTTTKNPTANASQSCTPNTTPPHPLPLLLSNKEETRSTIDLLSFPFARLPLKKNGRRVVRLSCCKFSLVGVETHTSKSLSSDASYVFYVVGTQYAGKSALVRRYVDGSFSDCSSRLYEASRGEFVKDRRIHLTIYPLVKADRDWLSYHRGRGFLLVFDPSNESSFQEIKKYHEWIEDCTPEYKHFNVLVGTKKDQRYHRQEVSRQEAEQLASSLGIAYFETSALEGSVGEPFRHLVECLEAATDQINLHFAARRGDCEWFCREEGSSIQNEALDPPAQKEHGRTPLHLAAQHGRTAFVEALLERGSQALDRTDDLGMTPVHLAASRGYLLTIELLVQRGSKALNATAADGTVPMHHAVASGHVATVEGLVRLGSLGLDSSDHTGRTPMHFAAEKGRLDAVQVLVRLGSLAMDQRDNNGQTPLYLAAQEGHDEVVQVLVRMGSRAIDTGDRHGFTPMHSAAQNDHTTVVETLARLGSRSIDTASNDGRTPAQLLLDTRSWYRRSPTLRMLYALGDRTDETGTYQEIQLTFDQILEIRHRVFFARSLTAVLLDETQYPQPLQPPRQPLQPPPQLHVGTEEHANQATSSNRNKCTVC